MLRKFISIMNPDTMGFSFDTEQWSGNALIHTAFRAYQTYGDGLTQHSSDWPITSEQFADYMVSLAKAMLADGELAEHLHFTIARAPNRKAIEFAASIVFKPADGEEEVSGCYRREKKTRYYSLEERKVTSADAKQYDKRYQKVESWCDGSPSAIYRMLLPEHADGLERYQWAHAIHQWTCDQDGQYMELPARFIKWAQDNDTAREMRDAFDAAAHVVESVRLRNAAESEIANVKRRLERKREQASNAA